MTIEQLHYVIEIVKAGSISAAANQLFISRTVLSSAVSRLENELGRKLFVRTSRGIHLTPFGKLFLDHIRPLHLQRVSAGHLHPQQDGPGIRGGEACRNPL